MTKNKFILILIAITIILLLSVGLLAKAVHDKYQLNEAHSLLNKELMEAKLEIGKAETKFGNAQKEISKLNSELKKHIKDKNEKIDAYGELLAVYELEKSKKRKVKIVYKNRDRIITVNKESKVEKGLLYQAKDNRQLEEVEELAGDYKDKRLSARCSFTPQEDNLDVLFEFNYRLKMLFSGQLVKTHTDTGAVNYYMNLYEVDTDGNQLQKLELSSFHVVTEDERARQFYMWAPHVDISGLAAVGGGFPVVGNGFDLQLGASFGFSVMGYGITKNDLLWRFINIGFDITDTVGMGFTPFQFNLGQLIPIISNLWVGPHVGVNIKRRWYVGVAIGAML